MAIHWRAGKNSLRGTIRYMYKIGYSAGEWYSQYLVTYDFAPDPCWISLYMMKILLYFLWVYSPRWGVNSWKIFPRSCNWACTLRNPCCGGWKISVGRLLLTNLLARTHDLHDRVLLALRPCSIHMYFPPSSWKDLRCTALTFLEVNSIEEECVKEGRLQLSVDEKWEDAIFNG